MLKNDLLRIPLEATGLYALWMLLRRIAQHRDRDTDAVLPYLRDVDPELLQQLFGPREERVAGFWNFRVRDEGETLREKQDAPVLRKIIKRALKADRKQGDEVIRLLFRAAAEARPRQEAEYLPQPVTEQLEKFWFVNRQARRGQRARLDLAREYIRRIHHNAVIVLQWASTQRFHLIQGHRTEGRIPPSAAELQAINALRRAAKSCRFTALRALIKVEMLMLFRFDLTRLLPIPSVAALDHTGRTGLVFAYLGMKDAVAILSRSYGQDFSEKLYAAL